MSYKTWKAEFYPVEAVDYPEDQAIEHSLQKWTGLLPENLRKHDIILDGRYVGEYTDYELLCVNFAAGEYDDEGNCVVRECERCPLSQYLGRPCDESDNSPYKKFIDDGNPIPMIDALKAAKEKQDGRSTRAECAP